MGLQISCSMDTEIQEEDALRTISKRTGSHTLPREVVCGVALHYRENRIGNEKQTRAKIL
jgi:hypothetical protein